MMRATNRSRLGFERPIVWVLPTVMLASCGGGAPTPPPPPGPVSVEITPATVELAALGAAVSLVATVRDADGRVLQREVEWSTSDPRVAEVNRVGGVVARGNGQAIITARAGPAQGTVPVTVAQVVTRVAFAIGPHDATAGNSIGPVVVELQDARGQAVTTANDPVTLSLVGPPGIALVGGGQTAATAGRAVWSSPTVLGLANDLRLVATTSIGTATSPPFSVVEALDLVRVFGSEGDVGLLLDGWLQGGPVDDLGFLLTGGEREVGVVTAGPSNEVVAFARGHPPALLLDASWQEGVDTLDLILPGSIAVPLTIWIVKGPFPTLRQRALEALATTAAIWDQERTGLTIGDVEIIDATANPSAAQFFSLELCTQRTAMETEIGKRVGRINVYYVERVDGGTGRGRACPIGGDFLIMAEATGSELLSHEIGHAFGLLHVDALALFDQTNIMHSASNTRFYVTEAQTFRMHFEMNSALTGTYAAWPTALLRPCGNGVSRTCPRIDLRLWADGTFPANGLESEPPTASLAPNPMIRALERTCTVTDGSTEITLDRLRDVDIPMLLSAYRDGPGSREARSIQAVLERRAMWRTAAARGGLGWMEAGDRQILLEQSEEALAREERRRITRSWRNNTLLALVAIGTPAARAALRSLEQTYGSTDDIRDALGRIER